MKYTIEIDYEQVDAILVQELKNQYLIFKDELARRLANDAESGYAVFENDKESDCAEIQSHLDAFAKVLSYNMVLQDYEDFIG